MKTRNTQLAVLTLSCGLATLPCNGHAQTDDSTVCDASSRSAEWARQINTVKLPDDVRARQIKNLKFGMFICWSFSTFHGQEWTPTTGKDASYFKATGCDTDQWCRTAREAGMNPTYSPTRPSKSLLGLGLLVAGGRA